MPGLEHTGPIAVEVKLELSPADPAAAIAELVAGFKSHLPAPRLEEVVSAVQAREQQAPTFLGYETALPHARLAAGTPWLLAVGRLRAGLPWGSGETLARFVFLSLVPAEAATSYLGFVRDLGRAIRKEPLRQELWGANNEAVVRDWLRRNLKIG